MRYTASLPLRQRKHILSFLSFFLFPLFASDLVVDLRNPSFEDGTFSTNEGGVIRGKDLRIQAKSIAYTKKGEDEVHEITAEGDLMVEYQGRAFIGKRIEYNLASNEGILYEGKTGSSDLYLGGEKVYFHPDGTYEIENGTLTNSPNRNSSWDLQAEKVHGLQNESASLQNVSLRLFQVPTLWLPSVKWNFPKHANESEVRTTFNFDLSGGPTFSMRYPLYLLENFSLFSRLEYKWSSDVESALEAEYTHPNGRSKWASQNFLGTDILNTKVLHYRLKGEYLWNSENEKTKSALTWDKSGDQEIAASTLGDDFIGNPAGEASFWLSHHEPYALFNVKARPRINSFDSMKEALPSLSLHFLPRPIGSTGILSLSEIKASYLRFSSPHFSEPKAGKCEVEQKFYRPTQIGPCTLTPFIGAVGSLSTNSPSDQAKAFGFGLYGLDLSLEGHRAYNDTLHRLQPYASFSAVTTSGASPDERYIFSINDSYSDIKEAKVGFRNLFFSLEEPSSPLLSTDLFAHTLLPQFTPSLSLALASNLPSLYLSFESSWNVAHALFNHANALCKWTVNRDVALTFEARYRSPYEWRKADPENFFLNQTRKETELLSSPLSDQRIALLGSLFLRIPPFWELSLSAQGGFHRLYEAPYQKWKIDLTTKISSRLKFLLSYNFSDKGHEFTTDLSLIKK
ncbi:MAG TPA: hypothetical protein VJK48_03375 [Chlamydiales bacterium]|nr:hypothetical protein [Chlamydiales bacterium]